MSKPKGGRPDSPAARSTSMKKNKYVKLPFTFSKNEPDPGEFRLGQIVPKEHAECEYLLWAIRKHKGDKPAAAAAVGVSLRTIYNLLHWYYPIWLERQARQDGDGSPKKSRGPKAPKAPRSR